MLDREGIARLTTQRLEECIASPPSPAYLYSLKMTSGTTNDPMLSMQDNIPPYFLTLRAYERFVLCHAARALRLSNAVYVRYQKTDAPIRIITVDPVDLVPEIASLFEDYAPDSMRGLPSLIIRLAEQLPLPVTSEFKEVHMAGELFTRARIDFLKEHFPRTRFKCTYISAETGMISASPCGYLPFNWYHPRDGVTIDIDAAGQEDAGGVLVTMDLGLDIHVERYRIGDSGRWRSFDCLCGAAQTFEVLGREGFDYIKILGCIIRAEEGERIFSRYKHLFESYRIEVEEVYSTGVLQGRLTLRTYSSDWKISDEEIRAFLEYFSDNFFMTPTKMLSMLVHDGVFEPVVFVQEAEPLPQGGKNYTLRFKK